MTPRQRDALHIVINNQPVTAASVAAHMGVQKNAANRYLLHLKRSGMVIADAVTKNNVSYRAAEVSPPKWNRPEPYEQAASVWQYGDRCRRMGK